LDFLTGIEAWTSAASDASCDAASSGRAVAVLVANRESNVDNYLWPVG
jgi:hypothetical protein